jgi:nucleotidyltransferase substrate binding protein (TIGR01987 family)
MNGPDLNTFRKAYSALNEAMQRPPVNPLERDGIIYRFAKCFDISWNSAKNVLHYQGCNVNTSRNVFREMAKIGWIHNPDQWIEFLEARNKTSHLYHEEVANELFKLVPSFLAASQELLKVLELKLT